MPRPALCAPAGAAPAGLPQTRCRARRPAGPEARAQRPAVRQGQARPRAAQAVRVLQPRAAVPVGRFLPARRGPPWLPGARQAWVRPRAAQRFAPLARGRRAPHRHRAAARSRTPGTGPRRSGACRSACRIFLSCPFSFRAGRAGPCGRRALSNTYTPGRVSCRCTACGGAGPCGRSAPQNRRPP